MIASSNGTASGVCVTRTQKHLQRTLDTYSMYITQTSRTHAHVPLLIVDAGEVAMDDGVVGAQTEGSEVGCNSSVKYPSLLQHVAEVNVGI